MSRRSDGEISSLDLLLDTICNAFGGIVFIALLMALLTQSTTDEITADVTTERNKLDAFRKQELIENLSNTVVSLERMVQSMGVNPVSEDAENKLADLFELQEKVRTVESDTRLNDAEAAELMKANDRAETRLADVEQRLERARVEIGELMRQEPSVRPKASVRRLPMMRAGMEEYQHIYLILSGRKAYLVDALSSDPGAHHPSVTKHELPDAWICEPNPAYGQVVRPGCERSGLLKYLFDNTLSHKSVLRFLVDLDSFAEFNYLKELAVTKGYRYHLEIGAPPHFFITGTPDDAM